MSAAYWRRRMPRTYCDLQDDTPDNLVERANVYPITVEEPPAPPKLPPEIIAPKVYDPGPLRNNGDRITIEACKKICYLITDFTYQDLIIHDRHRHLVDPRHFMFWMMREHAKISFPRIGEVMERDHATVLHGWRMVESKEKFDNWKASAAELVATLKERHSGQTQDDDPVQQGQSNSGVAEARDRGVGDNLQHD